MAVYCFDIDGTICSQRDDGKYEYASPFDDRIAVINELYDEGHRIIFHTARGMGRYKGNKKFAEQHFYEFTINQLRAWGVKYHELHLGKIHADFFIDDKGVNDERFFDTP